MHYSKTLTLGNLTVKNRICIPPMVRYKTTDETGVVNDAYVQHYRNFAKGGSGLIIQEATCVSSDGKLVDSQLGIWDDSFIEGLSKITQAVHEEDGTIFIQLHHAGVAGIVEHPLCPDTYTFNGRYGLRVGKKMTLEDIRKIQDDFVHAARRAVEAGYDGIELHCCHGYLFCQFLNSRVNRRDDIYGTDPTRIVIEVIDRIRKEVSKDIVIGVRLGAFEPTLNDGIRHAKELAAAGAQFINLSYGFEGEMDKTVDPDSAFDPAIRELPDVIQAAAVIKKEVDVPVFAVYGIRLPEDAEKVLTLTGVDMVCVGRSMLVDPFWTKKALEGEIPGKCLDCKVCQWRIDNTKCAGRLLLARP